MPSLQFVDPFLEAKGQSTDCQVWSVQEPATSSSFVLKQYRFVPHIEPGPQQVLLEASGSQGTSLVAGLPP